MLLLHRTLPADAVTAGMLASLGIGNFDPDLVAVEARRSMFTHTVPAPVPLPDNAAHDRSAPSLAGYDQLLNGASA
ncbi:hypothetical protein HJ581_0045585 [Rhodococcus opacus]|nr:hypothetical protein HJ581_0045585 [Rhodococcus opacus]